MSSDKLYFFSKSRDAAPGKGTNEYTESLQNYEKLSQIPRWRQILSNFSDDCKVKSSGLTYQTIEHAFQAAKIQIVDPAAAFVFAIESGSTLSRSGGAEAQKQRKMRKLTDEQLCMWKQQQMPLLQDLWEYKAHHSKLFRQVLMATNSAELWHVQNRKPAQRWVELEAVRQRMQTDPRCINTAELHHIEATNLCATCNLYKDQ